MGAQGEEKKTPFEEKINTFCLSLHAREYIVKRREEESTLSSLYNA